MAKQPLNQNKKMSEQAGMDMSLPGAAKRWKEILAWVHAELAVDNPKFGACKGQDAWKPCTKEEQVEERFLRRLLQADTAERIKAQADEFFCLLIPEHFLGGVGAYFADFRQVPDEEVIEILNDLPSDGFQKRV